MKACSYILIVDPDTTLFDTLSERPELVTEFASVGVGSGAEALERIGREKFELLVINFTLPDMGGVQLAQKVRSLGMRIPIIAMTNQNTNIETRSEVKIDHVLAKPFKLNTMLSLIRVHIWHHEFSGNTKYVIGPYIFYPLEKTLVAAEEHEKIRLTNKETAILRYLLRAENRVTSRDELLDEVWGYNSNVATHTLETHVYRLRKKIECGKIKAQILVTEPGGYRLVP